MYATMIHEALMRLGRVDVDPLHVEAWMRLEHGTLDALSRSDFEEEVGIAVRCHDVDPKVSVELAESYGLSARKEI